MGKTPGINPLKNFSVAPLTAQKMSDAYSKALAGAVTTPDQNQRILRQGEKTGVKMPGAAPGAISGAVVPAGAGLASALKAVKVVGQVKARKGM